MAASSLLRSLTRRGFAGPGAFNQFRHQHRSPFCTGAWGEARKWLEGFGPTAKGQKARVVVLGTRWAGLRLIKDLDTGTGGYDVVCVAPRGDMFTLKHAFRWFRFRPLEFRLVVARCTGVDPDAHTIDCETVTSDVRDAMEPWKFKIPYDKLVFACDAGASTFGIHCVTDHAIFLREVHHAQETWRRLLLNLMLSDVPGCSEDEKRRLLHCVVVGGGPGGVEFSSELNRDVKQRYSHVKDYIHVTLIQANETLSSFDAHLRQHAIHQLVKSGLRLVRGIVKDVQPNKLILKDGEEVPYGLLVWSTGVGPSFVKSLPFPKSPGGRFVDGGRIGVNEWLHVPSVRDVYAIGDCSGFLESTGKEVLPASAQVAEQQGKYLALKLNSIMKGGGGHANSEAIVDVGLPFVYKASRWHGNFCWKIQIFGRSEAKQGIERNI